MTKRETTQGIVSFNAKPRNIAVADLANGTDGQLITWDTNAAPAAVAVGTATHVLTSNGAGAAPTFQAASAAVARAGGQLSEATSTSTSTVDLLTASSLTIPAISPIYGSGNVRKSAGTTAQPFFGLKLNSTVTAAAALVMGEVNEAVDCQFRIQLPARLTNYEQGGNTTIAGSGASGAATRGLMEQVTANAPTAEITAVIIRGKTGNASTTIGADELNIYEMATS
jgi:hypothetical protein